MSVHGSWGADTGDVIALRRPEPGPSSEVASRVATRREGFLALYENRVMHELDRQTRAVIRLAGTIPATDIAMSLAFHYELARLRLARKGVT